MTSNCQLRLRIADVTTKEALKTDGRLTNDYVTVASRSLTTNVNYGVKPMLVYCLRTCDERASPPIHALPFLVDLVTSAIHPLHPGKPSCYRRRKWQPPHSSDTRLSSDFNFNIRPPAFLADRKDRISLPSLPSPSHLYRVCKLTLAAHASDESATLQSRRSAVSATFDNQLRGWPSS